MTRRLNTWLCGGCFTLLAVAACGSDGGDEAPKADAGQQDAGQGPDDGDEGSADAGGGSDDAGGPGEGSDGGGGSPRIDVCLAEAMIHDTTTQLLTFEGDGMEVGLVRYVDPESFGLGTAWLADVFALSRGGEVVCISDNAALAYQASRHNLNDRLDATAGDVRYTWTQQAAENDQLNYQFAVTAARGDTALFGPTALTLKSCQDLSEPGTACSSGLSELPSGN